jgi:ferredoxin
MIMVACESCKARVSLEELEQAKMTYQVDGALCVSCARVSRGSRACPSDVSDVSDVSAEPAVLPVLRVVAPRGWRRYFSINQPN